MVSERHDSNIIMFWLMEWRKQGGTVPKEFTSDMSLALLNAAALANYSSLDSYIAKLFEIVSSRESVPPSVVPVTFIRIDIAHLMKNVSDSDAFHGVRPKVKEFYIRCVADLVKETDLLNAAEHILNVLLVALCKTEGMSGGEPIPCETAKKYLEKKMMGIDSCDKYVSEHVTEDRANPQNELLDHFEDNESLASLNTWLKDIKEQAEITVNDTDDGDRDNLMYSPKFAKHFLRLCKLLPLWCGISCKMFSSASVTSSSANVESYFNDVKRTMKELIPCSPDVFVQNHMDGIDDAIITASRKYAKTIEPIGSKQKEQNAGLLTKEKPKTADDSDTNYLAAVGFDMQQFLQENDPDLTTNTVTSPSKSMCSPDKHETAQTCIACKDGNYPSDAHTCIECGKNIHILDGCSVSIGSEEGYGSKRICADCFKKQKKQEQDAKEMQYEEQWGKRNKTKKSKYLQPNPLFTLMSETKKKTIGLLKNGNQYTRPFYVDKIPIQLFNTCAPDALIQAIAGAYAYNHAVRVFYDNQPDAIVQIAISLVKK